jgi:hypothetical protein
MLLDPLPVRMIADLPCGRGNLLLDERCGTLAMLGNQCLGFAPVSRSLRTLGNEGEKHRRKSVVAIGDAVTRKARRKLHRRVDDML